MRARKKGAVAGGRRWRRRVVGTALLAELSPVAAEAVTIERVVTPLPAGLSSPREIIGTALSGDGRYVAWSAGKQPVAGASGLYNVFWRDRVRNSTVTLDSFTADPPSVPSVSVDGRYVTYLGPRRDNGKLDCHLMLWDGQARVGSGPQDLGNILPDHDNCTYSFLRPVLSADGSTIAYTQWLSRSNAGLTSGIWVVAVYNVPAKRATLVSTTADGSFPRTYSNEPAITRTGSCVTFWSDLWPKELGATGDPASRHETPYRFCNGRTGPFSSRTVVTSPANDPHGVIATWGYDTHAISMSDDGTRMAFVSHMSWLTPAGTDGAGAYVLQIVPGTTKASPVPPPTSSGKGVRGSETNALGAAQLAGSGDALVYATAENLAYVYTPSTGATLGLTGAPVTKALAIAGNGKVAALSSKARRLTLNDLADTDDEDDLFIHMLD